MTDNIIVAMWGGGAAVMVGALGFMGVRLQTGSAIRTANDTLATELRKELLDQRNELKAEVKELSDRLTEATRERDELKIKFAALEVDMEKLREDYALQVEETDKWKAAYTELFKQHEELHTVYVKAQSENQITQAKREELLQQVAQLQVEVDNLKRNPTYRLTETTTVEETV